MASSIMDLPVRFRSPTAITPDSHSRAAVRANQHAIRVSEIVRSPLAFRGRSTGCHISGLESRQR